jgi:hypothetical protein
MVVDVDAVAAAVIEVFQRLATVADTGWSRRMAGAFGWLTGVNLPTLNRVIVDRPGTVEVARPTCSLRPERNYSTPSTTRTGKDSGSRAVVIAAKCLRLNQHLQLLRDAAR